jgi:hypothetical protein
MDTRSSGIRHRHRALRLACTLAPMALGLAGPLGAQVANVAEQQVRQDRAILAEFRPGFGFWEHIFDIPDGWVAFGNADTGQLIASFPTNGDWARGGRWHAEGLADAQGNLARLEAIVDGIRFDRTVSGRRTQVAERMEAVLGIPVIHNPTRGNFVRPNTRRYGAFLDEWARIYERFGVPADIGLAQAMIESGWHPTIRSEAGALGFCQWLTRNWNHMKRLSPHEIEGHNQTTQAMYCAGYLRVLATKYGSFIPALSEHHAGGTNVGRTLINGARLGAGDVRAQYFVGAQLALDLRSISSSRFRDVVYSYGPRSFRYAEMVFGNEDQVARIRRTNAQERIYAMRVSRNVPMTEVVRRSGLSEEQIRRYNPALLRQVPRSATLYLPMLIEDLGRDVSFWHRPAPAAFQDVFREFLLLDAPPEQWHEPSFRPVLDGYRARFRATNTEEGTVMATVIGFAMDELYASPRGNLLAEYRDNPRVVALIDEGLREISEFRDAAAATVR